MSSHARPSSALRRRRVLLGALVLLLPVACVTAADRDERDETAASALLVGVPKPPITPIGPPPIPIELDAVQPLFSSIQLGTRFGTWSQNGSRIGAALVDIPGGAAHAEAQLQGVLGTDFTYSSVVTFGTGGEAHLQFRVSGEGRYGVGVSKGQVHLYKYEREGRATALGPDPIIGDAAAHYPADDQIFHDLQIASRTTTENAPHTLVVTATGRHFTATLDGSSVIDFVETTDTPLDVGHFGLYVMGSSADASATAATTFDAVQATANVLAPTNFALLFSTGGYDVHSTKRALVRSIDPLAGSPGLDLAQSGFSVVRADGAVVLRGALQALPRSFGIDLWAADMTSLTTSGNYQLTVNLVGEGLSQTLTSEPFEIAEQAFTRRMLPAMTFVNADARSAADHDFTHYWAASGAVPFGVATSGEITIRSADDGNGSVLARTRDNAPASVGLAASTFGYAGTITIDDGCDAQLQFLVNGANRYAVTLQAGDAGHCAHGGGPGAVRLHEEGPAAPGGFNRLASQYLPSAFVAGHPYDVRVRVGGGTMDVYVDDALLLHNVALDSHMPPSGGFALKAWGSSVRFNHVQAWKDSVSIARSGAGNFVPFYAGTTCSNYFQQRGDGVKLVTDDVANCTPIFLQRHGYHDCNNVIGEADSHGAFLSGLMDVWTKRAGALADPDRERLRRSILRAYVYLATLARQGAQATPGRLAHEEFGRGDIQDNGGTFQTIDGVYGLGAFAAHGADVNAGLAREACVTLGTSVKWLEYVTDWQDEAKALAYLELEQCSKREGLLDTPALQALAAKAQTAVVYRLATLSGDTAAGAPGSPSTIENVSRDTGRMIPWLEGAYEFRRLHPDQWTGPLARDAAQLATLIEARLDPSNGFRVLPQASNVDAVAAWTDMSGVPLANRPAADNPRLDWYNSTHFATTAADAVYLKYLTNDDALEPLATASLEWILGLNPGIPSTRVTSRQAARGLAPSGGAVWRSAAFIENFDAAFARGFEAFRTPDTDQKAWNWYAWELPNRADVHLEAWFFEPKQDGFMSIVNGHVLRDGQWDYWNQGLNGWVSGETFLLFDGIFSKASLLYETWRDGAAVQPLDTGRTNFFDTTTLDRGATAWSFQDVNRVGPAQAERLATDFCTTKGFAGGVFTGHQIDELEGVLCFPKASPSFDVTDAAVTATGAPIVDLETTPWDEAARAASTLCINAGYVGGVFTGYQTAVHGTRHVVCLAAATAIAIGASPADLAKNGVTGTAQSAPWAAASRAATNICTAQGYRGGFFTGFGTTDWTGAICLR